MRNPERIVRYLSEADRVLSLVPSVDAVRRFLEGGPYPGLATVMAVADYFENRALDYHSRRVARPPDVPVDPQDSGFRTWTIDWLRREHQKAHALARRVREALASPHVESHALARALHRYLGRLTVLLPLERIGEAPAQAA